MIEREPKSFPPGVHEDRPEIPRTGIVKEGTDILAPPRTLSEVMSRSVPFVHPDDDVASVAERMRTFDVGFLPVCDRERKVVGTITDRDLTFRVLAERRAPESTPVREVMSRNVASVRPNSSVEEAEATMKRLGVCALPVVDERGRLVGLITSGLRTS